MKNNYNRFSLIQETDSLINSIQKELKNIKYFLDSQKNSKDTTIVELRKKILNEIGFWEGKKSNKNNWKKSKSSSNINNDKILSLTNKERDLLKNIYPLYPKILLLQ